MLVHHRVTWFKYLDGMLAHHRVTWFKYLDGMQAHHRVTWFIYYKVTRSITTPPGWDASPSQGDLVYIL